MRWSIVALLLMFAAPLEATERSFRMGFTPFPFDVTEEAQAETYRRLGEHADIIAHHFDTGVPWPEAAARTTYPALVEQEIARRQTLTPAALPVYLALTPISTLRDGVASYWSNEGPVEPPAPWDRRDFGSKALRKAYLRYCLEMIERFDPDYMAYGIEVDILAQNDAGAFDQFVKFAKRLYRKLKRKHPELPIFLTFTLGQPDDFDKRRAVMERLLPYSDLLAVSTYPYLANGVDGDPSRVPDDWFTRLAEVAGDKPIAVAETGYAAETLVFETLGWTVPGKPKWQRRYVESLLADADALAAEFVIWFVIVDYDRVWDFMEEAGVLELFKAWRDTGLFDENLDARRALGVWDDWLARPLRPAN